MDRKQLLNDSSETMRIVLDGRQVGLWTQLPGIVKAVNFSEMTCTVQPAIQAGIVDETGKSQKVNLPLLIHVPILWLGGGDFIITTPIVNGDEVLIFWACRCIDAWWQSGKISPAMEARMHDLSDGFAFCGPRSQPNVISGISTDALQIRNKAGTTYIQLSADGKISLVSPTEIDLTAPLVSITGALVASGGITAATIATAGAGSATVGGSLNVTGQVTAGGIPLSTHHHTGVTTGGGTSGPPTP